MQALCLCPLLFLINDKWTRSSRSQIFFKIDIVKIFENLVVKHLCWSLFLIKLEAWMSAVLLKRDSNTGVFLWNMRNFEKHLFYRTLPVAASDGLPNRRIFEIFSEGFKNSCFQKKVSKRIHIFFVQSFYNPKYRLNLKIEIVQIFKISSRHLLYLLIVMLLTPFILVSNLLQSEPSFCKNNSIYGSSRSEVLYKKCVLRNFTKFTGKHLCQISFLQETLFSKNTFFT